MGLSEIRSLPASEVEEWKAYHSREPMIDPYWIGAQICQVVYNMSRSRGKPAAVDDFIPRRRRPRRKQTPEEMLAAFRAAVDNRGDV